MECKMKQTNEKINFSDYQDTELEFKHLSRAKIDDFLKMVNDIQEAMRLIESHSSTVHRLTTLLERERRTIDREIEKEKSDPNIKLRIYE